MRVLAVDDDERILAGFARAGRHGHEVRTARSAREAHAAIDRERPEVVIIDLRLGADCGIELLRELRARDPALRLVLISGYLSTDLTVTAVRAGAELVLFKPVTLATILARLEVREEIREQVPPVETPTLARAEWEHISRVLFDCNGNLSMAARRLGIYRSSLQRRLKKEVPLR
jgi:two-component system, response regulator RegA